MNLVSSNVATQIPATVFNYTTDSKQDRNQQTLKANVLHLINGEHFSGAERVQQLLGKRLGGFGYASVFACLKPGKFRDKCQLRENQILEFPMQGKLDISVATQIAHAVTEQDVTLLHAHTPRSALVAAMVARRTGLPWLYHVHSPTSRDSTRGLSNRINTWVERYAIRSCSRLLTVSRSLRREMLRLGVQRDRLQVVANGVPAFEPIVASERLGQQSWRLGIVALMRPRKGVEFALEAISKLPSEKKITLDLIGGFETPEYETQIRQQIATLGLEERVQLVGFQTNVEDYVRRLDALLLPSLFGEGMPMVVLEALSAAVPVVATSVEGTPEVIRHGVEGLLAEPRNSTDFASQIDAMTADRIRWLSFSDNALRRHREKFSDNEMASGVAKAYDRTLGIES
ncbi:MAG: glycosyltransferase family 4 protein [Aureliella sp.]